MIEQVRPGVVRIDTWDGSGSGVIIDTLDDGALVLTNYHVVENAIQIDVVVEDRDTFEGYLSGYDPAIDLAVLTICCGNFQSLPFGNVSDIRPGSEALAMGYPLDIPGGATVTRGIVSAIRPVGDFEVIQVDAPMNPGNSGGPLLSPTGEVLGINTVKVSGAEGLGFALSERMVKAALPELLKPERLAASHTPAPRPAGSVPTSVPATKPMPTATPWPTPTPGPTLMPTPTTGSTTTPTPTPTPTSTPTLTPEPLRLKAISAGSGHTCGIRLDGTPVCWGADAGTGKTIPPEGERLVSISNGQTHACGLREDGTLVCWGRNHNLEPWPEGEKFTSLSVGTAHTCLLLLDGTPVCRGWNSFGQATPPKGEKFISISSGYQTTCGLRSDGIVICWGFDWYNSSRSWFQPFGDLRFKAIAPTCGLRHDDTLVCIGENLYTAHAQPRNSEKFASISGYCGLRLDGTHICWWWENFKCQGECVRPPAESEEFASISTGAQHACALREDGTPVCWGRNIEGQATPPD